MLAALGPRLVTNGLLLHRHPELPLLRDCDAWLFVSVHHAAPEYQEKLARAVDLLRDWQARFGVHVQGYDSDACPTAMLWTVYGAGMEPFQDGRPRQSWENCRCVSAGTARGQVVEMRRPGVPADAGSQIRPVAEVVPYLSYQPLGSECSDADLEAFLARHEEPSCGMCPAQPERFAKPLPLRRGHPLPVAQ